LQASSLASSAHGGLHAAALAFGRFVFRYRDYLAPLVFLVAVLAMPPVAFAHFEAWDIGLDLVGVAVSFAGQALRIVVIGLAYIKRGGRQKTITADHLVCEGVFAHSRNPLYLANFLMVSGLLLIWNSPWAYLIVLPSLGVALLSIVRAEEEFLTQRFGAEYTEYCARVPRFVPRLRDFRQTLVQFDFDWRRVIRKEYGTTFALITVILALFVLEKVHWHGLEAAMVRVRIAGAIWLFSAGLWATARWAKKARWIDSPK
jgi:protein-S-isoprenylcysteine O-methyltransferase Ste14